MTRPALSDGNPVIILIFQEVHPYFFKMNPAHLSYALTTCPGIMHEIAILIFTYISSRFWCYEHCARFCWAASGLFPPTCRGYATFRRRVNGTEWQVVGRYKDQIVKLPSNPSRRWPVRFKNLGGWNWYLSGTVKTPRHDVTSMTMDDLVELYFEHGHIYAHQHRIRAWARHALIYGGVLNDPEPWPEHAPGCLRNHALNHSEEDQLRIIFLLRQELGISIQEIATCIGKANKLAGIRHWANKSQMRYVFIAMLRYVRLKYVRVQVAQVPAGIGAATTTGGSTSHAADSLPPSPGVQVAYVPAGIDAGAATTTGGSTSDAADSLQPSLYHPVSPANITSPQAAEVAPTTTGGSTGHAAYGPPHTAPTAAALPPSTKKRKNPDSRFKYIGEEPKSTTQALPPSKKKRKNSDSRFKYIGEEPTSTTQALPPSKKKRKNQDSRFRIIGDCHLTWV